MGWGGGGGGGGGRAGGSRGGMGMAKGSGVPIRACTACNVPTLTTNKCL